MFGKRKKVTLYLVYKAENGVKTNHLLTITETEGEACEYIYRSLLLRNLDHFKSWCNCHKIDFNDESSWVKYINIVLSETDQLNEYVIDKMKYSLPHLAYIFRTFIDYMPIGCSYETEDECDNFLNSLGEEGRKEFEDELKKCEKEVNDAVVQQ